MADEKKGPKKLPSLMIALGGGKPPSGKDEPEMEDSAEEEKAEYEPSPEAVSIAEDIAGILGVDADSHELARALCAFVEAERAGK